MNRKEVIRRIRQFCKDYNVSPSDCKVSAGAAMVLYGVRVETADIDMDLMPNVFRRFEMSDLCQKSYFNGKTILELRGMNIDLHLWEYGTGQCIEPGIFAYGIKDLMEQKRKLKDHPERKPEKVHQDEVDISKLAALMSKNKR